MFDDVSAKSPPAIQVPREVQSTAWNPDSAVEPVAAVDGSGATALLHAPPRLLSMSATSLLEAVVT